MATLYTKLLVAM